jgi:hypothetical protein
MTVRRNSLRTAVLKLEQYYEEKKSRVQNEWWRRQEKTGGK